MPRMWIDSTLEMAYEDDDFTDPWKKPEVVVYQHCNTGSSRMYYAWAPTIARHYRFIRVNRRGQGGSTVPPPGRHWTLKEWSDEMDVFLDRMGIQKVHVIGEATGSYVCLQYAYDHPDRVHSLTMINVVPNEDDSKLAERPGMRDWGPLLERGFEDWVLGSNPERFDPDRVDPDLIRWHTEEKLRQPHGVSVEVMQGMGAHILKDVPEMFVNLKVPSLVLTGDSGVIHNPETARRVQEMIPDCKVAVIDGVFGYIAHAAPERCAQAWLEFARGLG
jgi:pimeloyl-ACP methyl ester carboxylesterase